MEKQLRLSWDHAHLYINEKPFLPMIHEKADVCLSSPQYNTLSITLSAAVGEDLDWEAQKLLAKQAVARGKYLFWNVDFGFDKNPVLLQDEATFYSLSIALEELNKQLLQPFAEHTIGVSLFQGKIPFAHYFIWSQQQEDLFMESLAEKKFFSAGDDSERWRRSEEGKFHYDNFSAALFAAYLQRLLSFLPDELLAFCLIDVSQATSMAATALMLSKEKFPYLLLALRGAKASFGHLSWEEGSCTGGWIGKGEVKERDIQPLQTALCLPKEEYLHGENIALLEEVFAKLQDTAYRVIPEDMLTEAWNELTEIVVISSLLSPRGMRKIIGFCVAGGVVISYGEPLGLEEEVHFDEYIASVKGNRSRGIRTPDPLLPKQLR